MRELLWVDRIGGNTKVPLSAFACLVHFFVPLAFWRVIRRDECEKLCPRHDAFYLFENKVLCAS